MNNARVSLRGPITVARVFSNLFIAAFVVLAMPARAAQFEWSVGEEPIKGTVNTSVQAGAQLRVENRAKDLVGKANQNITLCPRAPNGAGTSCQGQLDVANPLHGPGVANLNSFVGEGPGVNQAAVDAPGQFSNNTDNGNLNYDRGDITQAVGRVTSDLTLTFKNYGLFARGLYFYDFENKGRDDFHPNMGTYALLAGNGAKGHRGDRGEPGSTSRSRQVYVPCKTGSAQACADSQASRTREIDSVEEQTGSEFQLLDANVYGTLPFFGGRELSWRVGRQSINWGESTILIVNSLNTFNPPNVNNLTRPAFLDLAEVLTPIGALKLATSLTDNLSVEAFYQYDWEQAEVPAAGSYLSTIDVNTKQKHQFVNLGFGKVPEDPLRLGIGDQIVLSAITDTGEEFPLTEKEAKQGGQYGITFKYYASELNNGTELGFYFANYHSRLPYFSAVAGQYGCLSGPGAPMPSTLPDQPGIGGALSLKDAADVASVALACPGNDAGLFVESVLPVGVAPAVREQNIGARGDAFDADSIAGLLEYPENIKLYGVSFNSTIGDVSIQGEIAYRPESPLQVDDTDLVFAALQNPLPWGNRVGGAADRFDFGAPGVGTFAQLPGARYTVPDFVSAYRGRDPFSYAPGERIRGWEYFKTAQYNIGGTYIIGPGNWFKANQILLFGELGATQVFDMPGQDELQIEGPATFTHASAGADGSGADGSQQSNSGVLGASGIRFNPAQQKDGFADAFAWGYRVIGIFRYDNVFPGISFENTVIWAQDINGIAPGPGENFIEGRKNAIINSEMRFGQGWSTALAYSAFFGGGSANLLRDRDFVQAGLRYRF